MSNSKLTRTQKQAILICAMLIIMVLVTTLTGLLGRNWTQFITRSVGGQESWAGIYVSLGNAVVYLSVLVLGGPWGAVVSVVGTLISDLILGAYQRILGSIFINTGMAFFIAAFCRHCSNWKRSFVVAAVAELIMLFGYFLFDLIVMREFTVAALAFLVDIGQAFVCGLVGTVILRRVRPMRPDALPTVKREAQ